MRKDAPSNVVSQHAGLSPEVTHLIARQHEGVHLCHDHRIVDRSDAANACLDPNLGQRQIAYVFAEGQPQARRAISASAVTAKEPKP
jgi:hypothetical protein